MKLIDNELKLNFSTPELLNIIIKYVNTTDNINAKVTLITKATFTLDVNDFFTQSFLFSLGNTFLNIESKTIVGIHDNGMVNISISQSLLLERYITPTNTMPIQKAMYVLKQYLNM